MNEYRQQEVTMKFYLPDNKNELDICMSAPKMYSVLLDIKEKCRHVRKYEQNPSEDRVRLAEEIVGIIVDEINLDEL